MQQTSLSIAPISRPSISRADPLIRAWTLIGDSAATSGITISALIMPMIVGPTPEGNLVFDGVTTVLGMAPVGGVYTLTQDLSATSVDVTGAATIITHNFRILTSGQVTIDGVLENDGGDASGATAGAGVPAHIFGASEAGGARSDR